MWFRFVVAFSQFILLTSNNVILRGKYTLIHAYTHTYLPFYATKTAPDANKNPGYHSGDSTGFPAARSHLAKRCLATDVVLL